MIDELHARRQLRAAERAVEPVPDEPPAPAPREPSVTELRELLAHARRRAALYRQRSYKGHGNPTRMAELERIAAGAKARLVRALARREA